MTDFAATRAAFHLPEGVTYLDGNSLGPMPVRAAERVAAMMRDEWAEMLITGWNRAGWYLQPRRVGDRIARLIGQALRDARDEGRARREVAARMAEVLGRPVSEAMLNKWSSEGSEDHRIPLDAFIALIHATGAVKLTGFVAGEFGLTVIEGQYAELIEAQLIEEQMAELQARRDALAAKRGRR